MYSGVWEVGPVSITRYNDSDCFGNVTNGSLDAKTIIPWLETVHTHIKVKNFFMHPVSKTNTFKSALTSKNPHNC